VSRTQRWLAVGIAVVLLLVVVSKIASRKLVAIFRERAVAAMSASLAANVDLRWMDVTMFPTLRVAGQGFDARYHGRTDVAPMIQVEQFQVTGGVLRWLWRPAHLERATLAGVEINIPPPEPETQSAEQKWGRGRLNLLAPLVIDEIVAQSAHLAILPRDPRRLPFEMDIHRLQMRSVGLGRPVAYRAQLTNPRPKGEIDSEGTFGPWRADAPGETKVSGKYTFRDVNLGTLKGLQGTLSSAGEYSGVLDQIHVTGATHTPDFGLQLSAHTLPLETRFDAVVDGTSGDVILKSVDAQIRNSSVQVTGAVVGVPGTKGRAVEVNLAARSARVEDLLWLMTKGRKPFATGITDIHAKMLLSPGEEDVLDRLRLDGDFGIAGMRFTVPAVREKIKSLSRRGQGRPQNPEAGSSVSNLSGHFTLANAVANFSSLNFSVEGAAVRLHGTYDLRTEALNLEGTLKLEAKLSHTTTGIKSLLLKLVDPLFSKHGRGAVLPIKITGTRDNPQFGLDFGH
jgi:AsmA-like C-terminal region